MIGGVAATVALALPVACSDGSPTALDVGQTSGEASTLSEEAPLPSTSLPSGPGGIGTRAAPPEVPPIEPLDQQLRNANIRDGGLGSLCWARWEVARSILAVFAAEATSSEARDAVSVSEGRGGAVRSEAGRREAAALESRLDAVRQELGKAKLLPAEVREFAARLAADTDDALSDMAERETAGGKLRTAARQFAFDSYPQLEEYAALSANHSSCMRP